MPSMDLVWLGLSIAGAFIALGAAIMSVVNLRLLSVPRPHDPARDGTPRVSVCIPARNEEANIEACVRAILATDYPRLEVVACDDQSTDQTGAILRRLAQADPRVKVVTPPTLPPGWNGKQHACWQAARASAAQSPADVLIFTDADVRFDPQAIPRTLAAMTDLKAPMVSTFPRQLTGTPAEALVVPMIFFILYSYLPFPQMRSTTRPSASAGCGQYLALRRDAYDAAGTHEAFKASMHDGIMLPRAVRRAGLRTDLFDGADLCRVRMYQGLASTWRGFAKNAYEGLGSVGLLLFITVLHALGHVLPWVIALGSLAHRALVGGPLPFLADAPAAEIIAWAAMVITIAQRLFIARGTRTPLWPAFVHPVSIALMTAIQWHSLWLHLRGARSWRGRVAQAPAA